MKQLFFRISSYLQYLLNAKGPNRIHSPFVFKLYMEVILSEQEFYSFKKFSELFQENLKNHQPVSALKTGSRRPTGSTPVSVIASKSVLPEKYQRLLFRLVYHLKPKTVLELGTSLGITTLYLAAPDSTSRVISLEGNSHLIPLASQNFKNAALKNIALINGLFSEVLPETLNSIDTLDFVFLDGDHRYESTIEYVQMLLPKLHANSVLVLDDIHWSSDMQKAWKAVQQMPEVTVTLDLYRLGLVFFRTGQVKQHFRLKF
jgi:predicted O-methyltransferase YrrM